MFAAEIIIISINIFASESDRFTDTSALGHFGPKTLWEGAAGQQQANRTRTCPCGSTCPGLCPAALPHYASCAAFVGRPSTSQAVLVVSLVLSRLDYGNATLAGLPGNQLDRLQSVMNAAARLVCSALKYEHITLLLRDLHWLRVPERIDFKLPVLVFRCLHGRTCRESNVVWRTWIQERGCDLRQRLPLVIPSSCRTTIGDRAFIVAAPRA